MGNIALNKTATANSYVKPYAPSKAVDGNSSTTTPTSRWLCNNTLQGCWLSVDLGASYLVNRWVVKHMPVAGWINPDYSNVDFTLQGSTNNSTWVNVDPVTNNSLSIVDRTLQVPVAFRYFRVYITKGLRANPQMASVVEFEIYQGYSGNLTNLAISAGTLTPAFNPATLNYTAQVNSDVASINVTPTALSPAAIIKVNNVIVGSGNSTPVALSFGSNLITVNVTDGAVIQNYTITVTRPGSFLSSLTVQSGSVNVALVPGFVKTTQAYTASVINTVSGVTFTPTAEKPNSTITINNIAVMSGQVSQSFQLVVGANLFTIIVTADGVSFPYTVTITRAGTGVDLLLDLVVFNYSGRGISSGSVNKTMIDTQTDYPVTVLTGSTEVTVSPTARNASVTIKVNNEVVASGGLSTSIPLNSTGTTAITIVTSSPDGTTSRTYTFTISKGAI